MTKPAKLRKGQIYFDLDFKGVEFRVQNLRRASFLECNFSDAVFYRCLLSRASFQECNLTGARFIECELDWTLLFENIHDDESDFQGPSWLRLAPGSQLIGAPMRRIFLYQSSLKGANVTGANLWGACLDEADLSDSVAVMTDFRFVSLVAALFVNTDYEGADFRRANLSGADFSEANLERCRFEGCVFTESTIWPCEPPKAALKLSSDADLRGADLSKLSLLKMDLRRADLRGANLFRSTLFGCDLSEANLDGVNLTEAVYDDETKFPNGFELEQFGAQRRG